VDVLNNAVLVVFGLHNSQPLIMVTWPTDIGRAIRK